MNSEDVEELAKQTLDSVKKRRQAGARKAPATRKQKSARQKSRKPLLVVSSGVFVVIQSLVI